MDNVHQRITCAVTSFNSSGVDGRTFLSSIGYSSSSEDFSPSNDRILADSSVQSMSNDGKSSSNGSTTSDQTLFEDLNEDLKELLSCSVCVEFDSNVAVVSCINGHSICLDCSVKVALCPICRVSLAKRVKNRMVTAIREHFDWRLCPHDRCQKKVTGKQWVDHVRTCEHKKAVCLFRGCDMYFSVRGLLSHAAVGHSLNPVFPYASTPGDDVKVSQDHWYTKAGSSSREFATHLIDGQDHYILRALRIRQRYYLWAFHLRFDGQRRDSSISCWVRFWKKSPGDLATKEPIYVPIYDEDHDWFRESEPVVPRSVPSISLWDFLDLFTAIPNTKHKQMLVQVYLNKEGNES